MFEELRPNLPMDQSATQEWLTRYQTSHEFYREVADRQAFKRYCQWYYTTARSHQQEMERMQGELNILSWFQRKSRA